MATEITVDSKEYGVWFTLKADSDIALGRDYDGKYILARMLLSEAEVLRMRDYLNEKYPVKHDRTDSHRFDEPEETGLYVTQSGRIVIRDTSEKPYRWNYVNAGDGLAYCSWEQLCRALPEAEFPLRKAKAVAE